MLDAKERLRDLKESKTKAIEKTNEVMVKLEDSYQNMLKLSQEKSSLEMKLQIKEQECHLLCAMQAEKNNQHQLLHKKIKKKKEKIIRLKEELQRKECNFHSVQQKVQTQQEELSNARLELKKQHEEVIQLQREEELACSYNIERERVSTLVQTTFTLTSDEAKLKVTYS